MNIIIVSLEIAPLWPYTVGFFSLPVETARFFKVVSLVDSKSIYMVHTNKLSSLSAKFDIKFRGRPLMMFGAEEMFEMTFFFPGTPSV